jgi:hypothetical protein
MVEDTSDASIAASVHGVVEFSNHGAERILAYLREEGLAVFGTPNLGERVPRDGEVGVGRHHAHSDIVSNALCPAQLQLNAG